MEARKKLRVLVLFSGSASSLRYLKEKDENYNVLYEIVGAFSNKKGTSGEKFCKQNLIPFYEFNTKHFCIEHDYVGKIKDMPEKIRIRYFTNLLRLINVFHPEIIMLSGFMLQIIPPLLGYYPIINVHPSDLTIKDKDGKPKYIGDDAVSMAIMSGETSTASTIHIVEREVDCGKIICVSEPLFVETGITPADHQEKMKFLCDGPAYQKAFELISNEEFKF